MYLELLNPAMYWLAMMFLEQNLISYVPFPDRIFKVREKRRQARRFFLLGALYYVHADQFRSYKDFFNQLAEEHFRQASTTDSSWYLPHLYLANSCSYHMQTTEGETRVKLLKKALSLYKAALDLAIKKNSNDTQNKIRIARALAKLIAKDSQGLNDWKLIKEAEDEVQDLISQDPANFDPDRTDCGNYLFSLSYWYVLAEQLHPTYIDNAEQKARRYVAYCLARSENLWDAIKNDNDFKSICGGEESLNTLKQVLDEKLLKQGELGQGTEAGSWTRNIQFIMARVIDTLGKPFKKLDAIALQEEGTQLAKLRGNDFKKAINVVLREVAKKVPSWVVDEDV